MRLCAQQDLTTRCFSSFFVSSLEEDPLYIAYADMMAKVLHSLNYFYFSLCSSAKSRRFDIRHSLSELCWRWRRGRRGRKRENVWGDWFLRTGVLHFTVFDSYSEVELTVLSSHAGKGNGEAKDAVPASQTTWSRSCRDGSSDDQCQQR